MNELCNVVFLDVCVCVCAPLSGLPDSPQVLWVVKSHSCLTGCQWEGLLGWVELQQVIITIKMASVNSSTVWQTSWFQGILSKH